MNNLLDITGIDILSIQKQMDSLNEISEMVDNGIINAESLDSSRFDDDIDKADAFIDGIREDIDSTLSMLLKLTIAIREEISKPDQINESNWDKD